MQIIVSIDRPPANDTNATQRWQKTVEKCELLAKQKGIAGIEPLGLGAWLIPSESGLPMIGILLSQAEEDKYPHRLIVVDERFSWRHGPSGFTSAAEFGGGNEE